MKVTLGKYIKEYTERNRDCSCGEIYSVTNSKGFVPSIDYFSKEVYSKDISNYKIVLRGMLAYNPSRINVGSVASQNLAERVVVSPLYVVVEPNKKYLETEYLRYFLCSSYGNQQIKFLTTGSVRDSLKYTSLEKIEIELPSIEKQNFVVKVLDKLNKLIALHKEQLKKLDELIKSLFIEMFGDPVLNEKNLLVSHLERIVVLKAGKNLTSKDIHEKSEKFSYPCYGGNGIRGYTGKYSHEGNYSLIGRQGALCGNVQYATEKFYATEHAVIVAPTIELDSLWLYYCLVYLKLNQFQTGAAQPGLNIDILNKIKIPVPPLNLQNQFAERVTQIDKSKFVVLKSLKINLELLLKASINERLISEVKNNE